MTPGIDSPYNTCVDYQRFVSALAYNTSTPPTTRVSDDGMFITFGSHTLSIAKWRKGLQDLQDEIVKELDDICLSQDFDLSIPPQSSDDWSNDTRGYGWTTTHQYLADKRQLLKKMLADPTQQLAYVDGSGDLQFNMATAWKFIHKCDSIVEKLALFSLCTAGQPPRVAEFVDFKFANSTRPRNMFHDNDSIWLTTRRVKSESMARREAFLPIKCHPQLTTLLQQYLLIVRPVEAELVYIVRGEQAYHDYQEFLWTKSGERMTADDIYKSIKGFFSSYCDVDIGIHDYRQIAVEIGRVFLGSEFEVDQEDLDVLAAQSGHCVLTAQKKYASEVGHLPAMSSDLLLRYGRISELWWEITGFKPNSPPMLPLRTRQRLHLQTRPHESTTPFTLPYVPPAIDTQQLLQALTATITDQIQQAKLFLKTEVHNAVAEALATLQSSPLQHAHSSPQTNITPSFSDVVHTLSDTQVLSQQQPELEMVPDREIDTDMTLDNIDDIYMPDSTENADRTPSNSHVFPLPVQTGKGNPIFRPTEQEMAFLHQLLAEHFSGQTRQPTFKSLEQMQAVSMALERKENFVVVLPTGGGKSLVFTLPPFNERGFQSYVVIPNKALLQDQKEGAEKLGLKVDHWTSKSKHVDKKADLVMVAIESVRSDYFARYETFLFYF